MKILFPILVVLVAINCAWASDSDKDTTETDIHPELGNRSRVTRLCMNADPNGIALIRDENGTEVLILFVQEHFYMVPANKLDYLSNYTAKANKLISFDNQYSTDKYWPNLPNDYIVSFSGQGNSSDFNNNILAFEEERVARYRVKLVNLPNPPVVELVIESSTRYWYKYPSLSDIRFMYIARGSSVLMVFQKIKSSIASYVITSGDMSNPVERSVIKVYNPVPTKFKMIKHMVRLSNDKYLTILDDGDICIEGDCKNIRQLTDCEPQILEFTKSLIYTLQQSTNLTVRLAIITLSSIMVVNFVLALSFIYNQVIRIYELT